MTRENIMMEIKTIVVWKINAVFIVTFRKCSVKAKTVRKPKIVPTT